MDSVIIGRLIREHFTWMGTCSVQRASSIRIHLNTGNTHIRQIIIANPRVLKNWTWGTKIDRVLETWKERNRKDKIKFLTSVGLKENTNEIEKALSSLHGEGDELRRRFNCLVIGGLKVNDVVQMIKEQPIILNQTVELLEEKISLVVDELGFPV